MRRKRRRKRRPHRRGGRAFEERLSRLNQLGYRTYKGYLRGRLWTEIRARIMERDGGVCRVCGSPANNVHHRSYSMEVLRGEDDLDLIALCGDCHQEISISSSGRVLDVKSSERQLCSLLSLAEAGVSPVGEPLQEV